MRRPSTKINKAESSRNMQRVPFRNLQNAEIRMKNRSGVFRTIYII